MSKYRRDDTPPETLNQMLGMFTKPGPPIADPTSVAVALILKIYMDMKSKVLLGDKQAESVMAALVEARARTITEVAHVKLRMNAVKKYNEMIDRLTSGGAVEI